MTRFISRLALLRRQAGVDAGGESGASPASSDLAERLARQVRGRRRTRLTDEELAAHLGGRGVSAGLIVIEQTLPADAVHGDWPLRDAGEALTLFGHGDRSPVFMDTETTGLTGGSGTLAFLLGLGRFVNGALQVQQYLLTGFRGEAALLRQAQDFIAGARTLVSYNGKAFDYPLLQARYRLAGLLDPFQVLSHLDLLHPTRRAFARRWPDCRLRTAEERLLGFRRVNDLPGSEAPATWFDWVRRGVTANLPRLVEHNSWDVVSLAALLPALQHSYEEPLARGADILAVVRHHREQNRERQAFDYLLAHRDRLDEPALLELARLGRRRGDWELAAAIWTTLASAGHPTALESLAKHHEHVTRNYRLALQWTQRLLALERDVEQHRRRERRLLAKLQG